MGGYGDGLTWQRRGNKEVVCGMRQINGGDARLVVDESGKTRSAVFLAISSSFYPPGYAMIHLDSEPPSRARAAFASCLMLSYRTLFPAG